MTWDGLVTNHFKRYMKMLEINEKIQAYMQTVVLKRTCESILIDCRQNEIWIEEEMSNIMDKMESNSNEAEI